MRKGTAISVFFSMLIIGLGAVGAYGIHLWTERQLSGGPLLATGQVKAQAAAAPKTAVNAKKTRKEIIEDSQKRVVTIESGDGLGSGFLYNAKGDLLTNAHVVAGSREVTVRTMDHREYTGQVIGIGTDLDVAVVRVSELKDTQPLPLARSSKAEVGDEVLALGSPLGLENTVTTGIISGVGRSFDIEPYSYSNLYQISAPITHGNSGGPLVSADTGEVLGINSAAATEEAGIGFSIPIASVLKQAEEWSQRPMAELPGASGGGYDTAESDGLEGSRSLVESFYQSLNDGDYVTAYSLLGSEWQSGTAYEDFRSGYLETGYISVGTLSAEKQGDGALVTVDITAEERRETGTVYQTYRMSYSVGGENGKLKILHGKGKKVD